MMVIFLVGLVSMILMRTLRKDYQRYSRDEEMDDMERDLGDEYGWKQVHGDVFRSPTHNMLFSSLIGTGYQLTTVVFSVIIFAIIGELYTEYVFSDVMTMIIIRIDTLYLYLTKKQRIIIASLTRFELVSL